MGSGNEISEDQSKKETKKPVKAKIPEETVRKEEQPAAVAEENPKDSREIVAKKGGKKKKEDKKAKKSLPDKTLCKLVKKDILKKHMKEYQALVSEPEYVCKNCGRVAKSKRSLCGPVRLG